MTGESESTMQMQGKPHAGFLGIFVVSFIVFLVIALVAQLCLVKWRPLLPGAEGSRTLIGGVKSAVYTFMSHLS